MRRILVLPLLCLVLCIALIGCDRNSASPGPTLATPESAATMAAPVTEAPPTESPAPTDPPVSEHYPLEHIPLPPGSEVLKVENNFDDQAAIEGCRETTTVKLSMTKTEAVAYFEPLLKKGVELYDTAGYDDVPEEILAVYPEVAAQTELYARYDDKTDNTEIIKVLLYTLADKETLVVSTIVVYYRKNPAEATPPETTEDPSEAPVTDAPPADAAPSPSAAKASSRLAGLTKHYPWERLPLPEGTQFVKAESVEDTDKYIEYTYISLTMTKTDAITYFQPLLEKDANFFTLDDNLENPPLEVQGAYPDVASFASLYSRYTTETEANISVIIVNLYTPSDIDKVLVAVIQVNYRIKP